VPPERPQVVENSHGFEAVRDDKWHMTDDAETATSALP
jgi:hypothetical protein